METVYISLGGDIGNKIDTQIKAIQMMNEMIGPVSARSSFYETTPWGVKREGTFVNSVVRVETNMGPLSLLKTLQRLEVDLGRVRTGELYERRTLDLDILYYGLKVIRHKDLVIPHPRLHERLFVLVPLQEIAPNLFDPVLRKPIKDLKAECLDKGSVQRIECVTTI